MYVNRGSHNMNAASPLQALELGIASAARWIAVELLKNSPAETGVTEEVSLWLARDDHSAPDAIHDENLWLGHSGTVTYMHLFMYPQMLDHHAPAESWRVQGDQIPRHLKICASKEQALELLIYHATPWIAAALAKEVG